MLSVLRRLATGNVRGGVVICLVIAGTVLLAACGGTEAGDEDIPKRTEVFSVVAPPQVPPPVARKTPALVKVELEVVEREGTLADGVQYEYWTFNNTVPGPMLRVRQGDTVELTLKNSSTSRSAHSIDLHAVTGPGGGAVATQVSPGGAKAFRFKALRPGLYVYHCATPLVPQHIANGLYGLILVEPEDGLPPVDREFYVMQGELYTQGTLNDKGLQEFSFEKMLAEQPEYVVFNGAVGAIAGANALTANVGEMVRIYFGVGGPNLTSSFHVIGEIFDHVHPEGAEEAQHSVQTTYVPAGGATWVDFKVEVPGTYALVDHSLSRLLRGAAGHLVVTGNEAPGIFQPLDGQSEGAH